MTDDILKIRKSEDNRSPGTQNGRIRRREEKYSPSRADIVFGIGHSETLYHRPTRTGAPPEGENFTADFRLETEREIRREIRRKSFFPGKSLASNLDALYRSRGSPRRIYIRAKRHCEKLRRAARECVRVCRRDMRDRSSTHVSRVSRKMWKGKRVVAASSAQFPA